MSERSLAFARAGTPARLLGAALPFLLLLAVGCGSVALSVQQPVGARVELYEKAKWFGACGPDWCTGWSLVSRGVVSNAEPVELELEASNSWLESVTTAFPRQYRAAFDLSTMLPYPGTPSSVVEVRYVTEVIPPKYQNVIRYWHEGRTLDALTHLPVSVLGDVLYNLGNQFKYLLTEVGEDKCAQAAKDYKTLLDGNPAPSPKEVESWLKSFLTKEQLDQLCGWVRDGVTLRDVRWVRLGGEPRQKGVPLLWRVLKDTVELVIKQPEVRSTRVNFFDVIVRDLAEVKTVAKLVDVNLLRVYADIVTYKTTSFTERALPAIDILQDQAMAVDVVAPSADEEAELQRYGMTRSVRMDPAARGALIRDGLPFADIKINRVTSIRSQILGALLEGEAAYIVIWNNPAKTDPERYLTTIVTTSPYGMARVWAYKGNREVGCALAPFEHTRAPLAVLTGWILKLVDQRHLVVDFDDPVAVMALGRRRLEPWASMPRPTASPNAAVSELAPAGAAGK